MEKMKILFFLILATTDTVTFIFSNNFLTPAYYNLDIK